MKAVKKIFQIKEMGVLIPLLLLWLVTYLYNNAFFSSLSMISLFRSTAVTALGTIGAAFVFSGGMMDVSAGAVYALSGMICAMAMTTWNLPVPVAILAGLCVGMVFGLLNGFIINRFGLPAFIATLGTQYIARGLSNVVTKGETVTGFPDLFSAVGSFGPFRIPWSVYITVILVVIVYFVF